MGNGKIKVAKNAANADKISIPKSEVLDEARHGKGLEGLLKRYFK